MQTGPRHKWTAMLDRLVAVKGSVLSIESDGKVYPRVSAFIVFKRVNCASCLVAFRTDATGKYSMILGEGKYEVFVMEFERNGKSYNALAPDQPRFIQVKEPTDGSYYQSSDIKIVTRGQSVVLDFSPDIGKEQSFLDKVLSDDNCRDCYLSLLKRSQFHTPERSSWKMTICETSCSRLRGSLTQGIRITRKNSY